MSDDTFHQTTPNVPAMSLTEQRMREQFEQFKSVNSLTIDWLFCQRLDRLCDDMVRIANEERANAGW